MAQKTAAAALFLGLLAVAAAGLSGPGYRWGWWSFREGFTILGWAAWAGAGAAVLALPALVFAVRAAGARGVAFAVIGLAAGLAILGWAWHLRSAARTLPAIHDITTDPDAPPGFVAILPLRASAANPAEYGGPEVAAQQRRAYPDIRPLRLAQPPDQAFSGALAAARRLGWTIVAQDPGAGRIEASDRTFWYGFVDDIVVRVSPDAAGARVDVRSVSRVGKSDVGANARRIRAFLRELGGRA